MEHECLVIKDGAVKGIREDVDMACFKEVKIPEGVTEIDPWAFADWEGLEGVTIPEGVTDIEDYAFEGCRALESVEIPASVVCIGDGAFDGCEALEGVTYGGTKEQWGKIARKDDKLAAVVHCTDGDIAAK